MRTVAAVTSNTGLPATGPFATGGSARGRSGSRLSMLGHQIRRPTSMASAGTRIERTSRVSSSTPNATVKASCTMIASGSRASAANVAANTTPAEVITPPVLTSPASAPRRVPTRSDSSRTRVIRKML